MHASGAERPAEAIVADDDALVRGTMARTVTRAGFVVTEVGSGEALLRLVGDDPARFRLAVIDVSMPGMGGLAAGDAARRLAPGLIVLFASGHGDPSVIGERAGARGVGFLSKPCSGEEFGQALRAVL